MKHYEETFIKQIRSGDRKAQKQLFEELYSWMFRVVYRYTVKTADAEDCVMKGFMKVFQNLDKFKYEGIHSLFVWVRKIMVNEALMFLRQNHNFMLSLESTYVEVPVQNEALHKINAEELNDMIMSLPTGYRTVFNLHVVEGHEHKDISAMLGISENTSRTQLAKAKQKLRTMLEQKEVTNGRYGK
jgi:RNA polymerase sigma factor (sigma-70 family)